MYSFKILSRGPEVNWAVGPRGTAPVCSAIATLLSANYTMTIFGHERRNGISSRTHDDGAHSPVVHRSASRAGTRESS